MNEQDILKFWQEKKIFEKSVEKGTEDYIFYDGPPFATGTPHYGHILASIIKDTIPRYQTMKGKMVPRRWGWDCHGLPIENLIEKELHLVSKKDIEAYGIDKFNKKAEESVLRYADEWRKIIPRIGRWVDMKNDYKTMDATYTESVWWVFKTLYNKGLVYEGYKPMHICPRCETTLSNFEVTQEYQDIKDLAVTVKFKLKDEPDSYVLAWTTTAWTLPGNVALAVGKDINYVKIKVKDNFYILAKDRLEVVKDNYEIIKEFKGKDLVSKQYEALFSYYNNEKLENRENGWKIYGADFVSTKEGTGIVHIAPAFGEDDMELGKKENLPFVQHVDMDGKIKSEVKGFAGLKVKPKGNPCETDEKIADFLEKENKLFAKEPITHSYPFCWRCETPLLNYAANSWFVDVIKIKDKILENNKKINWVPKHLQEGRFGKWLENAKDWAVSRSRYWGAPLPIWRCEKCKEVKVVGSIDEIMLEIRLNKIFLVRHGEAENNVANILNSAPYLNTYSLTEKGKEQIKNLAENLKKEKIDLIFSSPLLRTKETAEIIAKTLGLEVKIDDRLMEIDTGEFNGKMMHEFDAIFPTKESRSKEAGFGVETGEEIRERISNFLDEINKKFKNKNIIIVSHGDPVQIFYGLSQGFDLENTFNGWYPSIGSLKIIYSKPVDLHRPYIDEVEFNCSCGGKMKRIPEVFDCWFESGSMPYGQNHYPFENKENFEANFPAEFIAEGVDQTRGWFYTLLVLSTALFNKSAYKNVIANGIILAEDGQKMSKRLNNYPDPMDMVEKYGADALRFYLLSSPAVRAENLNFFEKGVDEAHKKVIMRLKNVLAFYKMYVLGNLVSLETKFPSSENILDKWILARLNVLTSETTEAMDKYELDKAIRPIADFVEDLSNWYVRRSRERFKEGGEDKNNAVATLRHVLIEFSKLIAPFMPFVAEEIYQELKGEKESVHLDNWPEIKEITGEQERIMTQIHKTRGWIEIILKERMEKSIKVRQPLSEVFIPDATLEDEYKKLIMEETNIKKIGVSSTEFIILNSDISPELKKEGIIRELIRNIQNLRKKIGMVPQDKIIELNIETDSKGEKLVNLYMDNIRKGTGSISIKFGKVEGEELKIDELKFKIGVKK